MKSLRWHNSYTGRLSLWFGQTNAGLSHWTWDLHEIKLVLNVRFCSAQWGGALLRLIEEEQMVFTSCQHQSPLPISSKMDLWCFTGQKKWANEWQETGMGRAGGGTGRLSFNRVHWQHWPKTADVWVWKRIWGFGKVCLGSKVLDFVRGCICSADYHSKFWS